MNRLLLWVLPLLVLAACNRVPDHAKYLPKNALSVVGIDTKSIGQKVAWESITGSDVMGSADSFLMRHGYPVTAEEIRNCGIDLSSTMYVFFRNGSGATPTASTSETVGILPLSDAGKWDAFLKKAFPRMQPMQATAGKAAQLDSNLIALWTDDVVFVRNIIRTPGQYVTLPDSTEEWQDGRIDGPASLAALEVLPKLAKDESLLTDSRFTKLAKSGHDVTTWVNYEQMMGAFGGMAGGMGSMFGNKLYKNTALALGTDFKDGKAEMEGWYYTSDELKEASVKMGSGRVSKEMVERLPKTNLAGFAAMGVPTESFRMLLDKMGLAGVANLALAAQGLSMDDLLGAFTGDVVASINNLRVEAAPVDTMYGMTARPGPAMDFVVALKLGQADKVAKLVKFMVDRKLMEQRSPNLYVPVGTTGADGVLMLDRTYAVMAKNPATAQAFLSGTDKKGLPEQAQDALTSSPTAFFVDVQQILTNLQPALASEERDRQQMEAVRNTFANLSMSGGTFSGDHFSYQARLNLVNPKDNALVQLMRFANRMAQIDRQYPVLQSTYDLDPVDEAALDTIAAPVPADAANAGQ